MNKKDKIGLIVFSAFVLCGSLVWIIVMELPYLMKVPVATILSISVAILIIGLMARELRTLDA